ncbi:hypothetical protein M2175_003954 [Bradyrhizobium elkanii]|uniref:hypothetical protein n=1 Tax=Bradyrhizobium TaxID=374 RepID=UPI0021680A28|nr:MULTISPECIES: hypothetical protein [Bradyrhizobium]MCS3928923.1 hypothetical protein [Bradyrhizobium elkanii]MCS3969478.1 hypothetical protein [Bradyrhizobium japonicum]
MFLSLRSRAYPDAALADTWKVLKTGKPIIAAESHFRPPQRTARYRRAPILLLSGPLNDRWRASIRVARSQSQVATSGFRAREQVSNELVETTKALKETQQQAVDQFQVVQDQAAAKAETKRPSEQLATLAEKLVAVQ